MYASFVNKLPPVFLSNHVLEVSSSNLPVSLDKSLLLSDTSWQDNGFVKQGHNINADGEFFKTHPKLPRAFQSF